MHLYGTMTLACTHSHGLRISVVFAASVVSMFLWIGRSKALKKRSANVVGLGGSGHQRFSSPADPPRSASKTSLSLGLTSRRRRPSYGAAALTRWDREITPHSMGLAYRPIRPGAVEKGSIYGAICQSHGVSGTGTVFWTGVWTS